MKAVLKKKLTNAAIAVGASLVVLSLIVTGLSDSNKDITKSTVMITNMKENSGGTGVILSSSNDESTILTNSHVCGLVKGGGKVKTEDGTSFLVKSYLQDSVHDLCLIKVASKLGNAAKLAQRAPNRNETATISGHPQLLPTVVTRGHFSGIQVIQILTEIRKCTKEEAQDETGGLICFFFGGMPIIKTYESVVVSATIMAGSSGSAVYNSDGELSGLVFAGSSGLSYAFIVPYEYVYAFLKETAHESTKFNVAAYGKDLMSLLAEDSTTKKKKDAILKKCTDSNVPKQVVPLCNDILNTI